MRVLAIDIGGTKVSIALIDFKAETPDFIVVYSKLTSELGLLGGKPMAQGIIRWLNEASETIIRDHGIPESIGVGFGGQFDSETQRCVSSLHITGWEGFDITELLSQSSGLSHLPIVGVNDAKAAAFAEASTYARLRMLGSEPQIFLYVTLSTGIGGAFAVIEPASGRVEVMRGAQSLAGEVGHLQVASPRQHIPEQTCACGGIACLERLCSGLWINRRTGIPAPEYLDDQGNFLDWVEDLASGLWSAVTMLDPVAICIGGGMISMGERLKQALTESMARRSTQWGRKPPEVFLSQLGGRNVLLGAALLAREVGNR